MKILANARGVAIIYVTLFLLVLGLLFFALGVDIGWMAYVKTQGQAATDASALAGAAAVPHYAQNLGDMSKVNELAGVFDSDNTVMNQNSSSVLITQSNLVEVCGPPINNPVCPPLLPTQAAGVRVTRTFTTPLFFARLLNGGSSTDISVTSTAWLGSPGGLRPTLPVALCQQDVYVDPTANPRVCVSPYFTEFSPNGTDNAGWWNKVGVGSANADTCKSYVQNPETLPYLGVGEGINLNNGEITACHKEIEKRFENCNQDTCLGLNGEEAQKACTVILPGINCGDTINQSEPVEEFHSVCISRVVSTPASEAVIEGTVTCNVAAPSFGGGESPTVGGVTATRPVLVAK